jgi:hypothetical protein
MNPEKKERARTADGGVVMSATARSARTVALATKTYRLKEPLVVDRVEARDPESGMPLYLFRVVSSTNANGPTSLVVLNERGEAVEASHTMEALFDRTILTMAGAGSGPGRALPAITIQPDTNTLAVNPGDTIDETLTVTIPKNAGPAKAESSSVVADGDCF